MKIALLQNDKSFLSFDLKDLLWLILVVGVWATQDYRIKYTNNVLKWNEDLQQKIGDLNGQIARLNEQIEGAPPNLMNIIRLEEQATDNIKRSERYYSSVLPSRKVPYLNQLQAILDAVNKHRDTVVSEIDKLKAQTK